MFVRVSWIIPITTYNVSLYSLSWCCHFPWEVKAQGSAGEEKRKWGKEKCKAGWGNELPCWPPLSNQLRKHSSVLNMFCSPASGTFSTGFKKRKDKIYPPGSLFSPPTIGWVSSHWNLIPPHFSLVSSGHSASSNVLNVTFNPNSEWREWSRGGEGRQLRESEKRQELHRVHPW